jgi:hypothetical protein
VEKAESGERVGSVGRAGSAGRAGGRRSTASWWPSSHSTRRRACAPSSWSRWLSSRSRARSRARRQWQQGERELELELEQSQSQAQAQAQSQSRMDSVGVERMERSMHGEHALGLTV